MHVIKSNLTSEQIRDSSILQVLPSYLLEGETEVEMVHRFKGDLVKTIQFLRERAFKDIVVVERKTTTKEKPKTQAKPVSAPELKSKTKKAVEKKKPAVKSKSAGQNKLF